MTLRRLLLRSLRYYWRTGVVVAFGVALAAAVITGSLLVGDSVSGSLRDTALARLGRIDAALLAPRFFRAALADDLMRTPALQGKVAAIAPVVLLTGTVRNADTDVPIPHVSVTGIDDRFSALFPQPFPRLSGRQAAINSTLANDLKVGQGGALILLVARPGAVPADSLFARRKREETVCTLRLEVSAIVPDAGAGSFSLGGGTAAPLNLFVDRAWLLRELGQQDTANGLLLAAVRHQPLELHRALAATSTLEDYGIKLVPDATKSYLSVQSDGVLLNAAQVHAAEEAAQACGATTERTSVYLATGIAVPGGRLNYAVIAGVPGMAPGEIQLNDWASSDVHAHPGDPVTVTYLAPAWDGSYLEKSMQFHLHGVHPLSHADRGLTPDFDGITNAATITQWNPPFSIDLHRVTPRDETYWRQYRATPKAFISLDAARAMWASGPAGAHTDWVTSVRIVPNNISEAARRAPSPPQPPLPGGEGELSMHSSSEIGLDGRKASQHIAPPLPLVGGVRERASQADIANHLLRLLPPESAGMDFRPVRQLALRAAAGSTDFAGLFLSMSFFLVLAAAGMAGMLMRLLADRRAAEAGIMLAAGFSARTVSALVIGEGLLLAAAGTLLGVPLGILYAWGIIRALTTWWIGAVGTSALWLHWCTGSLLGGLLAGLCVGGAAVCWGARKLGRGRLLDLLAGWQAMAVLPSRTGNAASRWGWFALALLAAAGMLLLLALLHVLPAEGAFFGSGAALLAAGLCGGHAYLRITLRTSGASSSFAQLALRSAAANGGRSLLTIGLLACAAFIIVAVAANTRDLTRLDVTRRDSGAGGFTLRAITDLPLRYDLNSPAGRAQLGFSPEDEKLFQGVSIYSFLLSPGEDISCLNIAHPSYPRVLGVPEAMLERGGFTLFTERKSAAPWQLLRSPATVGKREFPAAFCDADSAEWTLHSGLGQLYTMPVEGGRPATLCFRGVFGGSIFAGEILLGEDAFKSLFPSVAAPRYFLIAAPPGRAAAVADALRRNLGDYGVQVVSTRQVLNDFMRVQNTYLSTFLALGGLGVLLGSIGLIVALLRNALERRQEFALMLATGFSRADLAYLLMLENAGLLVCGLACGLISALLAVAPRVLAIDARVNWGQLTGMLLAILLIGLLGSLLAAVATTRGRLLEGLREE